jgi:hypothetical protein
MLPSLEILQKLNIPGEMAHNDRVLDADGKLISDTIGIIPSAFRHEDDALFRSRWASEADMRHIDVSAHYFRLPST